MFTQPKDYTEKIKNFWAKHPEGLSRDLVSHLCPPCAVKMEKAGITALVVRAGHMSPEAVEGLCDSLGGAEGFFDRCMGHDFGEFNPDDKEAFCAWLHNECLGKFPSESLIDYEKWAHDLELGELEAYRKGTGPPPLIYRAAGKVQRVGDGDQPFTVVASEESEDRTGYVVSLEGWQTENFQKNPVFLFSHNHDIPPIGSVPKVWKEGKQLLAYVRFDDQDDFAKLVKGKYQRGFMRAVSVGFRPLEFEDRQASDGMQGILFKRQELVELSAVAVPAHPAALQRAMSQRPLFSIPSEEYLRRLEALERRLSPAEEDSIDLVALGRRVWKA